jgi:hypothetical protein
MLDQKIDELPAVYKADTGETRLKRNVRHVGLKIGSRDESTLSAEGYGLPKLPDRIGSDFRPMLVALGLHEDLHFGEVATFSSPVASTPPSPVLPVTSEPSNPRAVSRWEVRISNS